VSARIIASGLADSLALHFRESQVERRHIRHALEKAGGRVFGKRGAAELIGMKGTTLQTRMKKLGIQPQP